MRTFLILCIFSLGFMDAKEYIFTRRLDVSSESIKKVKKNLETGFEGEQVIRNIRIGKGYDSDFTILYDEVVEVD